MPSKQPSELARLARRSPPLVSYELPLIDKSHIVRANPGMNDENSIIEPPIDDPKFVPMNVIELGRSMQVISKRVPQRSMKDFYEHVKSFFTKPDASKTVEDMEKTGKMMTKEEKILRAQIRKMLGEAFGEEKAKTQKEKDDENLLLDEPDEPKKDEEEVGGEEQGGALSSDDEDEDDEDEDDEASAEDDSDFSSVKDAEDMSVSDIAQKLGVVPSAITGNVTKGVNKEKFMLKYLFKQDREEYENLFSNAVDDYVEFLIKQDKKAAKGEEDPSLRLSDDEIKFLRDPENQYAIQLMGMAGDLPILRKFYAKQLRKVAKKHGIPDFYFARDDEHGEENKPRGAHASPNVKRREAGREFLKKIETGEE